jgi:LPS sulfotransferase NodH
VADCLPGPRYLHLEGSDPVHEALCCYLSQHPGTGGPEAVGDGTAPAPDFQEVRWLEAIISRQAQAWDTYFAIHGIDEYRIPVGRLRRNPAPAIAAALAWLGVAGDRAPVTRPVTPGPIQRRADQWLPGYLRVRRRLNGVVGVRSPRS